MKAFDRAYTFYKDLPPWAKGVVIVGGSAVTYFAARGAYKLIKGKLDLAKMQKEGKDAGNQVQLLAKAGIKPTITKAQAESFSNSLVQAFSNCGTDEDAVYAIMRQLKNEADVYLLIATYGVRHYSGCGWWNVFSSGQTVSLSAAISDELDVLEKTNVNSILNKNGIKFQFT